MTASSPPDSPCIGVFDSGSGGLSVLGALRRRMPHAPLLYIGDLAHAPYGDREPADVVARCQVMVGQLLDRGARMVVVACNTATVLGIAAMRAQWPAIAFVGVEPGVKPAAAATRNGRIAVMATPATAASERLRFLVEAYAANVQVRIVPCPGLASAIEHSPEDGPSLQAALARPCAAIREFGADTVVLGCTHYPFAASVIQGLLGDPVLLVDTATAVAERVATLAGDAIPASAKSRAMSTGATDGMTRLLARCGGLEPLEVERLLL